MLIYLITSLPKLYVGRVPKISKKKFINRVYDCLTPYEFCDLNLILNFDKIIEYYSTKQKKNNISNLSFIQKNLILIIKNTRSKFLYTWARYSLNLEEALTGIICKSNNLSHKDAQMVFQETQSEVSKTILKNYNTHDLGLSKRYKWFNELINATKSIPLANVEKSIDFIRLKLIDSLKTLDVFNIDYLLAYYLELSILERHTKFNLALGQKKLEKILESIDIGETNEF